MKRILLYLTLIAILLVVSGCGQQKSTEAGFAKEDLFLMVNGTPYRCNDNIEAVISNLGEDYEYAEGMSCDYDGLDKTFTYGVATFYTNPLAAGDLLGEIYSQSPSVSTSKGVGVGSTREEVLAAYGDNCEDLGDLLIYRLAGERESLCFELDNTGVWAVYLTNQSV